MGLLDALGGLFGPKPPTPEELATAETLRRQVQARCAQFRRLLSANKAALEIMADMEERLSPKSAGGFRPFDMAYVRSQASRVVASVYKMISSLNTLSNGAYSDLRVPFQRIAREIDARMGYSPPVHGGPLILPLDEIRDSDVPLTGDKMAHLGEIRNQAQLPVPDGFVVTTAAYHLFMNRNNLGEALEQHIEQYLQEPENDNLQGLFNLSSDICQRIYMAPMPQELRTAFEDALAPLRVKYGPRLRLALRSSAVGEDVKDASFAGQYATELCIAPDDALDVWREIISSKYSVPAMTYRHTRGIMDASVPMCVGVLVMVDAASGGVAYSRDPSRASDEVLINAVPGLPRAVVDGSCTPDVFRTSRAFPPAITARDIAHKPSRLHWNTRMELTETPLGDAADAPSLGDAQVVRVAETALMLEEFYGSPQDVEWAFDQSGQLVILQSRDLKLLDEALDAATPPPPREGLPLLLQGGVNASTGVGMGPVYIVRK